MYKIPNKTLGKVRITNNKKQGIDKEVKKMMKEKREVRRKANKTTDQEEKLKKEEERRIIEQKIKRRIEEIEEQRLDEVTMRLNDKINNYDILWKLKKTAQRKQESTFVIKDKNGNDIKEPDEIKDKVSEHYDNLYTNNEIQEGYREYNEDLEKLIEQCWKMEDELGEELSLSEELVRKIIKDLEKHKTPGPDNLTNEMIAEGGNNIKNSVVRMMKIIYRTEELPN